MKIGGYTILIKNLSRHRILIYGSSVKSILLSYVFDHHADDVFVFEQKTLYISGPVLRLFFGKNLFKKFENLWPCKNNLRSVFNSLIRKYIFTSVEVVRPKIIITMTDDDSFFHWLNLNDKEGEYFAIQNAIRHKMHMKVKYYLSNLFCYGDYEKEMFARYNQQVKNFFPVGPFVGGFYRYNHSPSPKKYDLALVSQWTSAYFIDGKDPQAKESLMLLFEYLNRYVSERGLKLVVLGRLQSDASKREKEFFEGLFKEKAVFISRTGLSTYEFMDQSRLILGFFSSALCESFAIGNRILYCDYSGTDYYNSYPDGLWLLRERGYESFKNRVDQIMKMSDEDYEMNVKKFRDYIMSPYSLDQPPHKKMKDILERYL